MAGKEKTGIWGMKEQAKVLFVVYRTEWWGCLDSLCRQECQKEDTLVYVMPIPRYDRDLGTTEMNYAKVHFTPEQLEGELPEDAILADYQTFSLEQGFERIYIHNPYDNSYYVDSVDGKYYSWNLKPYAEKLIYVPHLLCIGGIPEFVAKSPVCEHVDAIYVPREQAKYSLDVKHDEKVEVVLSGIPAYLERLEERLKGERQEGNGKGTGQGARKELLCFLSYDNLYYGTEKVVQKLQSVFEYMRGRKDIRLVFRPDEDIRARFAWLPETVRKKYVESVTYFQKNRVGVYDETADLYRAVVEADGVLSFGHPADSLFSVQGKYLLHLDNVLRPIPSEEDRCIPSLWAMTAVEEEDGLELWFVPQWTRLICRMSLRGGALLAPGTPQGGKKTGKQAKKQLSSRPQVEIVAEVPEDGNGWLQYINITKAGNCLYLSPFCSESIWKYDLGTGSFHGQYLPEADDVRITGTIPYGRYLYMIPRTYPGIVKYDTETDGVEIIDGWVDELERFVDPGCRKEPYFIWAVEQEGNMLYMASSKCDVWMEFDMENDSWQMKPMGLPGKRFVDMVKEGERVWLFPYCGDDIVLWDRSTGESQVVYTAPTEESRNVPYQFGLDIGDTIAVFPAHKDNLLLIPHMPQQRQERAAEGKAGQEKAAQEQPVQEKTARGQATQEKQARVIEVTGRAPCREKEYQSEYLRQQKLTYQFARKLKNGRILTYECYDGAFLVLDEKLQVLQKIYCRLPIEAVRRQQDVVWEKTQCSAEFNGWLSEGYYLPAMLDYFAQHGQEDKNDIYNYYKKKITQ